MSDDIKHSSSYIQALQKELAIGNTINITYRPALRETLRLIAEIDELIPGWPVE